MWTVLRESIIITYVIRRHRTSIKDSEWIANWEQSWSLKSSYIRPKYTFASRVELSVPVTSCQGSDSTYSYDLSGEDVACTDPSLGRLRVLNAKLIAPGYELCHGINASCDSIE